MKFSNSTSVLSFFLLRYVVTLKHVVHGHCEGNRRLDFKMLKINYSILLNFHCNSGIMELIDNYSNSF